MGSCKLYNSHSQPVLTQARGMEGLQQREELGFTWWLGGHKSMEDAQVAEGRPERHIKALSYSQSDDSLYVSQEACCEHGNTPQILVGQRRCCVCLAHAHETQYRVPEHPQQAALAASCVWACKIVAWRSFVIKYDATDLG